MSETVLRRNTHILEIKDHRQALERLDDDERGRYSVPTPGRLLDGIEHNGMPEVAR